MLDEKNWASTLEGYYKGETRFAVPMEQHTSLRIGGAADVFTAPGDPLSLRNLIVVLKEKKIPFSSLGGGTNILVSDGGIEGVVISLKEFARIETLEGKNGGVELFVEAGVFLQRLVSFCRERGYAGVEGLTGIPGTVGGAVFGNAGSYGCEMKDVISSVAIMNAEGRLDRFAAGDLGFGYRRSGIRQDDIILSANIRLSLDDKEAVSQRIERWLLEKKAAQPIGERSAGCVFKNPAGTSAGRLIDEAGCKGMEKGDIKVSEVHANFFVNKGKGTAADYIALMGEVSEAVVRKFGITLEPEIQIIGRGQDGQK